MYVKYFKIATKRRKNHFNKIAFQEISSPIETEVNTALISLDAPVEENSRSSKDNLLEFESELSIPDGFSQSKLPTSLSFEPEFALPNFESQKFSGTNSIFYQPFFSPPTIGSNSSNFPFKNPISNELRSPMTSEDQIPMSSDIRNPMSSEIRIPISIPEVDHKYSVFSQLTKEQIGTSELKGKCNFLTVWLELEISSNC
jgi:hypothetical protein